MPAAKKTPAKTSVKPGSGQVLDVSKPGAAPPTNAGSKPVIVSNKPLVQDPMVLQPKTDSSDSSKKSGADTGASDAADAPAKTEPVRRRGLTIQPLSKDLKPSTVSIKDSPNDNAAPADSDKPATTDELAAAMAESADSAIAEAAAVEAAMAVSAESTKDGEKSAGKPDESGETETTDNDETTDTDKTETAPELSPDAAAASAPKPLDITAGNDAVPVDTPSLSSDEVVATADDASAAEKKDEKTEPAAESEEKPSETSDEPDVAADAAADTESRDAEKPADTEPAAESDAKNDASSDSADQAPADITAATEPAEENAAEAGKDGAATGPEDPAQAAAKAEAEAKEKAAFEELVNSKKYFLPINSLEKRRSQQVMAVGVLFALLLVAAWLNIALDAGFIEFNGVKPLTDLF